MKSNEPKKGQKWKTSFFFIIFRPQINLCYFQLFVPLRKALIIEVKCTFTFQIQMFNVQSPFHCVFQFRFCKSTSFYASKQDLVCDLNRFEYIRIWFMHVCDVSVLQVLYCHESWIKRYFKSVPFGFISEMMFYQAEKPYTLFIDNTNNWNLLCFCPGNRQHPTFNTKQQQNRYDL